MSQEVVMFPCLGCGKPVLGGSHLFCPMSGIDVHSGLRVTLAYEKGKRTIVARYSGDGGDVRADVEQAINDLRRRVGYLEAWLIQYRRQQGEQMERPAMGGKEG